MFLLLKYIYIYLYLLFFFCSKSFDWLFITISYELNYTLTRKWGLNIESLKINVT